MTPEELAADNAYKRKYRRKWRAAMTPEELDALKAYRREYARRRKATMTPEQLEALREYQREYHRKWRESRRETKTPIPAANSSRTPPSLLRASAHSRGPRV
jgi:hypothetical protein